MSDVDDYKDILINTLESENVELKLREVRLKKENEKLKAENEELKELIDRVDRASHGCYVYIEREKMRKLRSGE